MVNNKLELGNNENNLSLFIQGKFWLKLKKTK